MNLAGVTITFMIDDSSFSGCDNNAIKEIKKSILDADKIMLKGAYKPKEFHRAYFDYHYRIIPFYKNLLQTCGYKDYVTALPEKNFGICYKTITRAVFEICYYESVSLSH